MHIIDAPGQPGPSMFQPTKKDTYGVHVKVSKTTEPSTITLVQCDKCILGPQTALAGLPQTPRLRLHDFPVLLVCCLPNTCNDVRSSIRKIYETNEQNQNTYIYIYMFTHVYSDHNIISIYAAEPSKD